MTNNDGFVDQRTSAELLLAPAKPASRVLLNSNTLKLGLGGLSVPGVISNPSQITGAIRESFKGALAYKSAISQLSSGLSSVLTHFDSAQASFSKGNLIQPDPLFAATSKGLPNATDFFSFSSIAPGQSVPASFKALIAQRKKQIQGLATRAAGIFNSTSLSGVQIQENMNRTPYPLAENIDAPSISKLAQGGSAGTSDSIYKDKMKFTVHGVQIGTGKPGFWGRILSAAHAAAIPTINTVVNQKFKDNTNKGSWSEPATPYAAQYPFNQVQQTESGHVIELDDTPNAERIHIFHRSGSFIEWHPDGTVVYKNMKNGYLLTMGDQFVKVSGNCHIAVDGNATLYAKGDVHMQADGEFNLQAKKDFNVFADNINLRAKKTVKCDGINVDLRYLKLPGSIIPYFAGLTPTGQFGPRINLAALKADFPSFNAELAQRAGVDGQKPSGFTAALDTFAVPTDSPLSNPAIYAAKTAQAVTYRAKLFDTPEEVGNFEQYAAHLDLQNQLGDVTADPKALAGTLRTIPTVISTPTSKPTVNLLNFDEFKGKFTYTDTSSLAGTSFTIRDVVDTYIHKSIMVTDMAAPLPPSAADAPTANTTVFADPPRNWENDPNLNLQV